MTGKRDDPDPGIRALLAWYAQMGVVDLVAEQPVNRFGRPERRSDAVIPGNDVAKTTTGKRTACPPDDDDSPPDWVVAREDDLTGSAPVGRRAASTRSHDLGSPVDDARTLAASCDSLEALAAALRDFDGCPLKETAINLCFADGNPQAPVMMIGEAPGAQEDRQGKPFVGPSGKLLDRMLASIDLDRTKVYITNVIYWRPPGNRSPTAAEIAVCQPFLERQIELLRPKLLVFVGGIAARALLGVTEGVTKLRGRPFAYRLADGGEIPAVVMFHPAYLLRQPAQKRLAWRDLLLIKEKINNL